MIKLYKDFYIYLTLYSLIIFGGYYFIPSFEAVTSTSIYNTILCHFLMLANSFLVFHFFKKINKSDLVSFTLSAIYLSCPIHFDVFLFASKIQILLAESLFLGFSLFCMFKNVKPAFFLFCAAVLLNTKLFIISFFLFISRKISLSVRILALFVLVYFSIQLLPEFVLQKVLLANGYKTFLFQIESLLMPINIGIFNFSLLLPGYPGINSFLMVTALTMTLFMLRSDKRFLILSLFISAIIINFIPLKYVWKNTNEFYYLSPTENPLILLFFLILAGEIFSTIRYKTLITASIVINVFFLLTTINFQRNTIDLMDSWNGAISTLKSPYHFEDKVTLKYAQILLDNNEIERSSEIIEANRKKFPSIEWYNLALRIAGIRQSEEDVKKIHQQLLDEQIPFIAPQKE